MSLIGFKEEQLMKKLSFLKKNLNCSEDIRFFTTDYQQDMEGLVKNMGQCIGWRNVKEDYIGNRSNEDDLHSMLPAAFRHRGSIGCHQRRLIADSSCFPEFQLTYEATQVYMISASNSLTQQKRLNLPPTLILTTSTELLVGLVGTLALLATLVMLDVFA